MDSYEHIAGAFHQRIDCIAGAVDELAPGLEAASATIVQTLLNDGKILIVACGGDAALATYLALALRSSHTEGPALPALHWFATSYRPTLREPHRTPNTNCGQRSEPCPAMAM